MHCIVARGTHSRISVSELVMIGVANAKQHLHMLELHKCANAAAAAALRRTTPSDLYLPDLSLITRVSQQPDFSPHQFWSAYLVLMCASFKVGDVDVDTEVRVQVWVWLFLFDWM